jgi:hypothetical protein
MEHKKIPYYEPSTNWPANRLRAREYIDSRAVPVSFEAFEASVDTEVLSNLSAYFGYGDEHPLRIQDDKDIEFYCEKITGIYVMTHMEQDYVFAQTEDIDRLEHMLKITEEQQIRQIKRELSDAPDL